MLETLYRAEAYLVRAGDIDVRDVLDIRATLGVQLKAYTAFKHGHVFPKLVASRDAIAASSALRMQMRCERIGSFYEDYRTNWPAPRIVEQQAVFRGVGLDVIGRLRQHFYREEMDIARLIERPASASSAVDRSRLAASSAPR